VNRTARLAAWPLVVSISCISFALGFASGWAQLALFLGPGIAWVLILAFEAAIPWVTQPSAWRDPQAGQDLFHTLVGQGIGNQLGAAIVAGALALPLGWAGGRFGMDIWPAHWPLALQIAVGVFLADGIEYARHRAEHSWNWLWPVHALHHSVDRMHVLKSGRGHFLDMVLRHVVAFLPMAAVGVPAEVLLAYIAAVNVLGPIGHSNVDVRVPAFLHSVLMTPQVHRIHHARSPGLTFSNYANVFPVWDVLFGTFRNPSRVVPDGFGIENDPMPGSLWGQLASPFAWRRFTQPTG
jgi:sterol desaturase/sphingolipid hydroxylase (fatty acid hydroxylase superfamily)